MRCKACNAEYIYATRKVKLEDGSHIDVEEELCPKCRGAAFATEEPSWKEYMTDQEYWAHIGLDVSEVREPSNTTKRRKV